jgi:hypothetical protein
LHTFKFLYISVDSKVTLLGCLTPLLTLFQLYRGMSFIGGGNHQPATSPWTNFIT